MSTAITTKKLENVVTNNKNQLAEQHRSFMNKFWEYLIGYLLYMKTHKAFVDQKLCVVLDVDGTLVPSEIGHEADCYPNAVLFMTKMIEAEISVFLVTRRSPDYMDNLLTRNGICKSDQDSDEYQFKGATVISKIIYLLQKKQEQQPDPVVEAAMTLSRLLTSPCVRKETSRKRRNSQTQQSTSKFRQYIMEKSQSRKELLQNGYCILSCIGDALTDMHMLDYPHNTTQNILIPNPYLVLKC